MNTTTSISDNSLHGVEVFASGTHRGKTYTAADVDDMVRNFNRFSRVAADETRRPHLHVALVTVPGTLGHDEEQKLLSRDDLPAAGWATRAWAENARDHEGRPIRIARMSFDHVPDEVRRLINGLAYRTVSAEIYDRPPDGIPGAGKMFRRIAFLGAGVPELKNLKDIPVCERTVPVVLRLTEARCQGSGTFACYSEVRPMNRDEMLQQLTEHGFAIAVLTDAVPEQTLGEILRVLSRNEPAERFSETFVERVVQALERRTDGTVRRLTRFADEQEAMRKKALVEQFCETYRDRILPAELDRDDPSNLYDRLMLADAATIVRKFQEKGEEVGLTEFDLLKRSIEKRSPIRFGERLRDPKSNVSGDDEELKIRAAFQKFSEELTSQGTTEDKLLASFKAVRSRNPRLTAHEHLPELVSD